VVVASNLRRDERAKKRDGGREDRSADFKLSHHDVDLIFMMDSSDFIPRVTSHYFCHWFSSVDELVQVLSS